MPQNNCDPHFESGNLLARSVVINSAQQKNLLLVLCMLILFLALCGFSWRIHCRNLQKRQKMVELLYKIETAATAHKKMENTAEGEKTASFDKPWTSSWENVAQKRQMWQTAMQAILPYILGGKLHQLKIEESGGSFKGSLDSWQELQALNHHLTSHLKPLEFKLSESRLEKRRIFFTGSWTWEALP